MMEGYPPPKKNNNKKQKKKQRKKENKDIKQINKQKTNSQKCICGSNK